MELVYDVAETATTPAIIKVIGIGGGGCNAINNMIANAIKGAEFISANTDAQSLQNNQAPKRIQLGSNLTKGLGAGANPEVGRNAALEEREAIADAIRGAHMLFITTGMGGGTGTGAAPVVAEIARELGILTVAVVTRPFEHEGKRIQIAKEGLETLKKHVDSLIVIPNDKLMTALGEDVTVREAFRAADNVLRDAVAGITEVVTSPGMINLDFADVRNIMSITGMAMMGSGQAQGLDRARLATEQAISSPLLDDVTLEGARGVLVNITTAPERLGMREYREIMALISQYAHEDAELKYGTAEDKNMAEDEIRVTIIATGLQEHTPATSSPSLKMIKNTTSSMLQATGTDDGFPEISSISRSNRSSQQARALNLVAADFANQSVLDDFEIPAVIRRQAD